MLAEEMNREDLVRFIAQHKLAVLSTVNTAHLPQSALIGVAVTPALELVFDTVRSSRKYANLRLQPSCSLVIGWSSEKTLQYEGSGRELTGAELAHYQEIYFEVWPECRSHQAWPGITYFVVKPKWIRYSDFAQSPPFIAERGF
jgi:general stress protein 26